MEGCHLPAQKNAGRMNSNLTGWASVSWVLKVPFQPASSKTPYVRQVHSNKTGREGSGCRHFVLMGVWSPNCLKQ